MPNQHEPKITDDQFKEALMECHGIIPLTVQYIIKKYNVTYTKQSAYERAKNFPEVNDYIINMLDDHCSAKLIAFADDETGDIRLRARLYSQMINRIDRFRRTKMLAATRGYLNRRPEQVYKLHGKIQHFGNNNPGEEGQ